MSDFASTLAAFGLRPKRIVADGRFYRCATDDKPKKRNGCYMLRPCGTVGFFKNYATDIDFHRWSDAYAPVRDPAAAQRLAQAAQAQLAREAQERQRNVLAMRKRWALLPPLVGGHPYLARKGLTMQGCFGLLRSDGDALVVPVYSGRGEVLSLQAIWPDGRKRFAPGCPVKGGMVWLRRPGHSLTVLVEGFATGLAVFQALPICRVLVCFDAGNLVQVAGDMARDGVRLGMAVVAADNDHATLAKIGRNPGIEQGQEAARLLGAGVAWPQELAGSDWNDLLVEATTKDAEADARPRWHLSRRVRGEAMAKALARLRGDLTRAARMVSGRVV